MQSKRRPENPPGQGNFTLNQRPTETADNSAASQRQRILSWLRNVEPLTTLQARKQLDVLHPAARVMELRKAGNVAEYVLVIEPGA